MTETSWYEGNIKLRGTTANIKQLLEEIIEVQEARPASTLNLEKGNGWRWVFHSASGFEFLGTPDAIIDSHKFAVDFKDVTDRDPDLEEVEITNFLHVGKFDKKYFKELSYIYNVDIKIWGANKTEEKDQVLAIVGGEVISHQFYEYGDYFWDSIYSSLGGEAGE